MKFPMIVYKSADSDYCGFLPDFPGIFMAEKTLESLADAAQDAADAWMEGEAPEKFPPPSSLDSLIAMPEAKGRVLMLVDISPEQSGTLEAVAI